MAGFESIIDIYGTAGDDQLEHLNPPGPSGWIISVWGGAGNDTIRVAYTTAYGEAGNDTIIGVPEARAPGASVFPSVAYWNSPRGVDINLVTGIVQDGWGTTDTLTNITWIRATNNTDRITGSVRDEQFWLGTGSDIVIGGGGNDQVNMGGMTADVVATRYDIASTLCTLHLYPTFGGTEIQTLTGISQINYMFGDQFTVTDTGAADGGKRIVADRGADIVVSGAGNDIIDAGAGVDTVIFSANRDTYDMTRTESGFTVNGADGNDILIAVERLGFHDHHVAYDIDGTAGKAFRLYQAAFDRTPDTVGLGFWIRMMDNGISLATVAQHFVGSGEFKDVYGTAPTNAEFVNRLYANILNRAGDADGVTFWTGVLDRKEATFAEVLQGFSEGAENHANTVGIMQNGVVYDPYG